MKSSMMALAILFGVISMTTSESRPLYQSGTVPAKWANKIKRHLETIEQNGWGRVVPGDLYHGHLILKKKDYPQVQSIDELFENSALILYHSDEMLERWLGLERDLQIERRKPRSIVGYWDGRVIAAVSLIRDPETKTLHYTSFGTVHSDELAAEMQDQLAFRRDRDVRLPSGNTCTVNLIVDISITYSSTIRTDLTIGDRKYTLTMDCASK